MILDVSVLLSSADSDAILSVLLIWKELCAKFSLLTFRKNTFLCLPWELLEASLPWRRDSKQKIETNEHLTITRPAKLEAFIAIYIRTKQYVYIALFWKDTERDSPLASDIVQKTVMVALYYGCAGSRFSTQHKTTTSRGEILYIAPVTFQLKNNWSKPLYCKIKFFFKCPCMVEFYSTRRSNNDALQPCCSRGTTNCMHSFTNVQIEQVLTREVKVTDAVVSFS